jgi:hypothetical protein
VKPPSKPLTGPAHAPALGPRAGIGGVFVASQTSSQIEKPHDVPFLGAKSPLARHPAGHVEPEFDRARSGPDSTCGGTTGRPNETDGSLPPDFWPRDASEDPKGDYNFTTLSSSTVYLIFWGKYWNQGTGSMQVKTLDTDARAILASPYLSQLTDYGSGGKEFAGGAQAFIGRSSDPVWTYKASFSTFPSFTCPASLLFGATGRRDANRTMPRQKQHGVADVALTRHRRRVPPSRVVRDHWGTIRRTAAGPHPAAAEKWLRARAAVCPFPV